ncbi:general stress protein [Funiculus sociatus GB2-A5]|jgi:hypothetical protein|uniref:General stress protein n=1 Tax=Funiculus sociatus GB2-A5 TaxID=2933946 RepID=A0ABV0JTR4_9CYAN|nr:MULTISPECIES: general stress protein [unclassified Trichocoleus]MBD1904736.1 general stress protein [Trichocoleus sp. FACHB-832]MBD1934154.1 general stress protein [Trichocoleus sp. FACHB-69]MBD2062859.1 general stress protein [Trichocoleus sp. FACHB-6]
MEVSDRIHGIGVFSNREEAQQGINELKASDFPMDKVSVIARDADHNDQLSGAEMSDRVGSQDVGSATGVVADAVTGATWGTVLVGLTSLAIPGVGPVLAAGSLGVALLTGVAGTGLGALASNNLVKAMTDLGIPEEQARAYSDRLHLGKYLLIVDGSDEDIHRAEAILSNKGIKDWGIFNPAQV